MKKLKFMMSALLLAALSLGFTACSDDDDPTPDPTPTPTPTPDPTPDPTPEVKTTYHFDLFLTIEKHGGMSKSNHTIVASVPSLEVDTVYTIEGVGTELDDYTMECISKGKYYYQIPVSNDRFIKYQIKDNKVEILAQQAFVTNTYTSREYDYAWLSDNTLLIVAADGEAQHVLWTKLNTDDMSIIGEGTIEGVNVEEDYDKLTTSGIITYREADNKLFYFYYSKVANKDNPMRSTNEKRFHCAEIDPSTMTVEHESQTPFDAETAGSAYGELLQQTVMYDDAGNMYVAAFTDAENDTEPGSLLRISAGANEFDATNYYENSEGKLLTIQYIGNNKAFIYTRNDAASATISKRTGSVSYPIDSFGHYYAILDLNTHQATRLQYNGADLAYSGGRFSQRSVVLDDKVYFATNTENDENAIFYIYDINTGSVTKGSEVKGTYYFDVVRAIEDDAE